MCAAACHLWKRFFRKEGDGGTLLAIAGRVLWSRARARRRDWKGGYTDRGYPLAFAEKFGPFSTRRKIESHNPVQAELVKPVTKRRWAHEAATKPRWRRDKSRDLHQSDANPAAFWQPNVARDESRDTGLSDFVSSDDVILLYLIMAFTSLHTTGSLEGWTGYDWRGEKKRPGWTILPCLRLKVLPARPVARSTPVYIETKLSVLGRLPQPRSRVSSC